MRRRASYVAVVVMLGAVLGYAGGAEAQFNLASLTGNYGVSGSGTLLDLPAAVVGLNSFDGTGGCTIQASLTTALLPGAVIPLTSTQCSYTVNANGTGAISVVFAAPPGAAGPLSFTSSFVITDSGNQLPFVLTDSFQGRTVASGISRKQ